MEEAEAVSIDTSVEDKDDSSSSSSAIPVPLPTVNTLPTDKSLLRRFCPPVLERKHSSGDLHSRLKTRKILGVGETDNGDIHRSKISQVLGHNEHLYLKLPKGYWNWHLFLTTFLALQGGIILLFPTTASEYGLVGLVSSSNSIGTQYYAATLLALSFLLWKFLYWNDKTVTRALQYAVLVHFIALLVVDFFYALGNGLGLLFEKMVLIMILFRIGFAAICIYFWRRIGSATSGLRKSPSYKDLNDQKQ